MFAIGLHIGRRGVLEAGEVLVRGPEGAFHFAALM
jgi:hypothetical protein